MKLIRRLFAYKRIQNQIDWMQTELNKVTKNYSHKLSITKKAQIFARKNELIFAIEHLKILL